MPLAALFNSVRRHSFNMLLLCSMLTACSLQTYAPAPLDVKEQVSSYLHRNLQSPELEAFLNLHEETIPTAQQAWPLTALIHSALFLHPDLALAKASYRSTQLAQQQGLRKPLPSISTQIARSNRANGDIDPFGLSLSIDLPIQTNDKQAIRVARLSHLSEIAKLDIAQTAWQIRAGVMQASLALYQQDRQATLLNEEINIRQKILRLLEKRVAYGEANNVSLHQAQQALAQAQHQRNTAQKDLAVFKAKLAQQMGVSAEATSNLNIDHQPFDTALQNKLAGSLTQSETQQSAVINHLRLRQALLQYSVAEQALKLEYAKQIPDIVLSPGYAFEFGDSVWSLGFNSLMTLLQKNKVGIAQATQLRDKEVAQFEATQHQVISAAQVALAEYQAASQQHNAYQAIITANQEQALRLQKQFDAGLIGRLDLTLNELSAIQVQQTKLSLEHQLLSAMLRLEAAIQTPVVLTDHPFEPIASLSSMIESAP